MGVDLDTDALVLSIVLSPSCGPVSDLNSLLELLV